LTSRERVLAAINHREPDRVPIDIGGTEDTGLHGIAYNRLKAHLGLSGGTTRLFHVYMQLAAVEDAIRSRFAGDVVRLSFEPGNWKPWTLADGSPCEVPQGWNPVRFDDGSEAVLGADGKPLIQRHADSPWFSPTGPVCPFIQTPDDVTKYNQVIRFLDRSAWLDETIDDLVLRARKIRAETDYAIAGVFGGHIFAAAQLLRGMANFMCDLAVNEKLAVALMETLADLHIDEFAHYIDALGPYLDVVCLADDFGAQGGPQIDPAMWRRLVKPSLRRLYTFMKGRMNHAKLFLHSCGSVYDLIPDLIEMGVDILNPVQVSAAHMDSAKLKTEFGRDLVFWGGGCDTQTVLPLGTPDQVRDEVRRRIDDLAPGGGFVFAQVHNIQPDVRPENMVAMWNAAREFGRR
jgi:uroporphyrinogen decarboxylase